MFLECWNFLVAHIFIPIGNGAAALWQNVLSPFGTSIAEWVQGYLPWCVKFAEFCTKIFKLKYMGKIYFCLLMLPLFLLVYFITWLLRPKKRRRKNKNGNCKRKNWKLKWKNKSKWYGRYFKNGNNRIIKFLFIRHKNLSKW